MRYGCQKGMSQAEALLNSEVLRPVAFTIVKLCAWLEALVSQSVNQQKIYILNSTETCQKSLGSFAGIFGLDYSITSILKN